MPRKVGTYFLFVGLAALLLVTLVFVVYRRFAAKAKRTPIQAEVAGFVIPQSGDAPPPPPQVESNAMSDAFEQGVLPDPLPPPTSNPDDAVATLAKQIAARDQQSTPALMTALQMAGYTIRSRKGETILQPTNGGQGMAFNAFSVAAMARLYDQGWQITLDDLDIILGKTMPALSKTPFSTIFLEGIAASAQGDQPLRFWSRLIIELGRNSRPAYDLTAGNVNPHSVHLDAVQISLILMRLGGDIEAASKRRGPPTKTSQSRDAWESFPGLLPAVYHPRRTARLLYTKGDPVVEPEEEPCFLQEGTMTVLDLNAIYRTTEWKQLAGVVEEPGEGGPFGGGINAVLTLLKFILTYSALRADVTMDQTPLIRTKDLDAGQTRILTARVWFDLSGWPTLNCLRPFLNLIGVDFGNLPNNGAAKGVGVSWFLNEGGVDLNVTSRDPNFLNAQQAAIVMFDNGGGSPGSVLNRPTDEKGKTTTKVSGRPQIRDLSHFKVFAVNKRMTVAIEIKLKGADVEGFFHELPDVVGPALGVASGDLLGGLIGGLTETLMRMSWRYSKAFPFPVKDWKPCERGWMGTITYSREEHLVDTKSEEAPNTGCCAITTHLRTLSEKRAWNVNSSDGIYQMSTLHSDWSGEFKEDESDSVHTTGHSFWCQTVLSDTRDVSSTEGADAAKSDWTLQVTNSNFMLFGMPNLDRPDVLVYKHSRFHEHAPSQPNGAAGQAYCEGGQSSQVDPPRRMSWNLVVQPIRGAVDPKNPEHLDGVQEMPDPDDPSGKVVVSWDLTHCEQPK